ncbi:NEQ176 [Nanoarchaeum equitans Kin4-M]|uniref:Small ribosomal subunit protein eS31 n=1 Tax=Nanoarchaeum equitans (strain Kin4-M) TaxID=228908 RepID=RS27A_NANEQ|nr:RecName: Full=Small ribosomal subunit protein eS31; AltName: Full=30S ribosomal protein S27ae [Nanoarchaeum equitans Kin4-M]AAR39030.1 NEQ176 [Nanoarchaeum equitans Kin4-M]
MAQVWKYYEIKDGKLIRKKKVCPRCGSFMAEHKDRYHCGKCGYTEWKVERPKIVIHGATIE